MEHHFVFENRKSKKQIQHDFLQTFRIYVRFFKRKYRNFSKTDFGALFLFIKGTKRN